MERRDAERMENLRKLNETAMEIIGDVDTSFEIVGCLDALARQDKVIIGFDHLGRPVYEILKGNN